MSDSKTTNGVTGDERRQVKKIGRQIPALLRQVEIHLLNFKEDEKRKHLAVVIDEFKEFFKAYNQYFEQFGDEILEQGLTQEYVLATAFSKTLESWITLNHAVSQRYNPAFMEKLEKADSAAETLCAYLQNSLADLDEKLPVSYFGKVYDITRSLYSSYPLLGIPLSRYWEGDELPKEDLGALAHELGHHVFWNSGDLNEYEERMRTLRRAIAEVILGQEPVRLDLDEPEVTEAEVKKKYAELHIWLHWAEEAFADVLGTLLIGPVYAKSTQDLQIRRLSDERGSLVDDDGEHPMPYLRPLIPIAVLARIAAAEGKKDPNFGDEVSQLVDNLRQRWEPYYQAGAAFTADSDNWSHGHEHEVEVLVTPRELDHVDGIVDLLLDAKLFPRGRGKKRVYASILESVTYWGQDDRREEASHDLGAIIEELEVDILPPVAGSRKVTRSVPDLGTGKTRSESISSPVLDRLLHHIRQKREKQGEDGQEVSTPEWKDLLDLELSASLGHSSNTGQCRTHLHRIKHIHRNGTIALC